MVVVLCSCFFFSFGCTNTEDMIQTATLQFMEQLAANNNRPWFEQHKDEYLAVKENFEALVTEVLQGLGEVEPTFRELNAKDCIMRIYRDVRFSKDKSPYKVNLGAGFSNGGRKFTGAGYYLHIEPGKSFIGGGIWMPDGPILKAIRQEIDYGFNDFLAIIENKQFKKLYKTIEGEKLVKLPKGYTEDNPALEYLKLKSFTVSTPLTDAELTKKGLAKKITESFATMKPFVDFLNRTVA